MPIIKCQQTKIKKVGNRMSKKKNVNSFGYVIDPYKPVERPYGQSYSNIDVNGYVIDPSKPVYESSSAWDDEDDYEYAESSSEPGFLRNCFRTSHFCSLDGHSSNHSFQYL